MFNPLLRSKGLISFSPALRPVIQTVASVCCSRDSEFCSSGLRAILLIEFAVIYQQQYAMQ
jgi:hypothetical protein